MSVNKIIYCALIFLLAILYYLFQPTISIGSSVKCIDGDTFAIGKEYFRLAYVDTPEKNQPLYKEAGSLACRYLQNNPKLTRLGKDKYNRTLVVVGELNNQLIKQCLAEPFWTATTPEIKKLYENRCR